LGFHQFYCADAPGRESQCVADVGDTQTFIAELLKYGSYVEAPMEIFIAVIGTPPTQVHEFSMSELCSLGIKVWDMHNNRFRC